MANDFTLSGHLLIRGIQGLDIEIPKLRRQLETLKIDSLDSVKKLPQSFDAASAAAKRTGREIAGAATNLQDFGDKAALALRRFTAFSIAAGATFGAAKLIVGGLKEAAVFQRELVKVQQVSGATANSIASLRDEITRLGHALAAPASELVAVSTTLSQAGFKIAEVKSILEDLSRTRLAATFGSLQDTTEGIIAISGQFKIKVSEMGDALGITNAVAAKYAVESEDLISAIRRTGGVFASASSGISQGTQALSEFYALFSSVRQTTRQANETISTGLRTVFARLERPKTINYFKDLGIDLTDASGKFVGVFNAIQKIGQALDGLDTRSLKFAEIVDAIGGARQLGVVVPLIKEWRLQQEILNTALGGTKSLINDAIAPLDTLVERVNILANDWSAFSRDVFNSKTFQVLAKEAISFASAVVKAADSISSLLPIFAALGAVKLGAAIASEGAVSYVAKRLTTGVGGPNIHRAIGGHIPGVGNGDTVPILATPGEFVIRKGAAEALGPKVLNKLNHADKYAMGGMIGRRLGYEDGGIIGDKTFRGDSEQFLKEGQALGASLQKLLSIVNKIGKSFDSVEEANIAYQEYIHKLSSKQPQGGAGLAGGGASGGSLNIPTDILNKKNLDVNSVVEQARIKSRVLANNAASRAANQASNYTEQRSQTLGGESNSLNLPRTDRREYTRSSYRNYYKPKQYRTQPLTSEEQLFHENRANFAKIPTIGENGYFGGSLSGKKYNEPDNLDNLQYRTQERNAKAARIAKLRADNEARKEAQRLKNEIEPPITLPSGPVRHGVPQYVDRSGDVQDLSNPIQRLRRPGGNRLASSSTLPSYIPLPIIKNGDLHSALGGYFKGETSVPSTLNVTRNELGTSLNTDSRALREARVAQENYNLYGPTPEQIAAKKKESAKFRRGARYFTGLARIGSGDLGGFRPAVSALGGEFQAIGQDIASSTLGTAGINASKFVGGKALGGIKGVGSRLGGIGSRSINGLANGARGIGRRIGEADALTLGLLSAGVQYGGDKLGVDQRVTGTLSGALGGAAAGSALGGPYGAAAGAVVGGAVGFVQSAEQKELDSVNKELTSTSKDLTKAFEDLSSGGVKKLDDLLSRQSNLSGQLQTIGARSTTDRISAAFGTSLKDINFKSGLDTAALGTLTQYATGTNDKYSGDDPTGKGAGSSILGDVGYQAVLRTPKEKAAAQDAADRNAPVAQAARDRIKFLTSRGRGKDITDNLLQASFSDDREKLRGLADAKTTKNDKGATLRNLIGEARNNLANNASIDKGKGFDLALKNIDTFANQLDKTSNLLGLFSANLEQSQTAIEAAFNTTQGNFSINKKFQNPFDNIEALSPTQIRQATSNLEGNLGGAKLDTKFKQVLESSSTLADLPNIINKELEKADKAGVDVTDSSKFIGGLLNRQGGPLGNLPGRVKTDLRSVFDSLSPEDAKAYLSGESDNKNAQEINNKVNQITKKSTDVAKKFQDSVNDFSKTFYVDAANQRSTIQSQGTRLGATREDLIGNQTLNIDRLKDKLIDPNKSAALELNPIKALTGGLSDPTQIGNRIRGLQAARATAESGVDPQTGKFFNSQKDQSAAIGSLNSSLTTATEGLNKLATTAIGLAAIEAKLAIVKERENNAANSALSDALGGGQQDRAKGEAALALFDKTKDLRAVAGQGFSPEDLERGIKDKQARIALITGDKEKGEQFFRDEARAVNLSSGRITGDPRAAENEQVFKDTEKEKKTLVAQATIAQNDQVKALEEQRKLLADNLKSFDDTITSKFLVGVTQLAAVAKQLSIPESISISVHHEFGQLNITGLNLAGLTPAMQKIAQDAVGLALSKLTDGQNKGGTPIPGNIRAAVDEGFGG